MLIVKNDNTGVEGAIKELEETYNIKLPDVYRRFLLKYNGGKTPKTTVKASEGKSKEDVRYFYSIAGETNSLVWLSERDVLQDFLDDSFLPIAEDDYGNMFLLNLAEDGNGKVFFYIHDRHKVQPFSSSFTEFIKNAKSKVFRVTSLEDRIKSFEEEGREVTEDWIEIWQEEIDRLSSRGDQEEVVLD